MTKKIDCIMLVDDNPDDNFFHERIVNKSGLANTIISIESGQEALAYLKKDRSKKNGHPDLIFLDVNMPGMNDWEFMEAYNKLDKEHQSRVVVVMLTTSVNPDDRTQAATIDHISDFRTKPLTQEMLHEVIQKYF